VGKVIPARSGLIKATEQDLKKKVELLERKQEVGHLPLLNRRIRGITAGLEAKPCLRAFTLHRNCHEMPLFGPTSGHD
jgi:hypothetical protein